MEQGELHSTPELDIQFDSERSHGMSDDAAHSPEK